MEARLREYRAARRRQETVENAKQTVLSAKEKFTTKFSIFSKKTFDKASGAVTAVSDKVYPWIDRVLDYFPTVSWNMDSEEETKVLVRSDSKETINSEDTVEDEPTKESWKYFILKWSVYTIIWLTMFAFFVSIEFGAVFFIISMLVGVCINTRTKPRKKGEVSPYSVFNKDCKSIDGTLTAQQFEREIMYGPGFVG